MAEVLPSEELIEEPSEFPDSLGALQPGMRLGRYELLVPIARGGMARVWAARLHGQRGFQKLVAIKVILPHLAQEPEFERMFLDEARIASGVHHPNVCEIYELGEEQRTLYLVMEWVSGDSFSRVLRASGRTEAVDPRVVARIVADACAGLHAAHELTDDDGRPMGVVHRDLSPHNILLTADGTAKVCDFGVAKALGQLHEATSAGQLKGKIAYMAPEQITGSDVDRRSDVFSMGCVLYEATTGVRPFRGEGDHQVMHAVLKGEVAPPTTLVRGYPMELERIVMRALAPKPLLRFPTAERMRFALEELLARGALVTQANVAQMVKSRIGEGIERRRERIRQASLAGDHAGEGAQDRAPGFREPGGMTPSQGPQGHGSHRSGVQPSSAAPGMRPPSGRPLVSTLQMQRPDSIPALQRHPSAPAPSYPGAAYTPSGPQPSGMSPHGYASPGLPPPGFAPVAPGPAFAPPAPERAPAGAGQYAMAIVVGVLLAAVIGGAAFAVWKRSHPASQEDLGTAASASTTTTAGAVEGGAKAPPTEVAPDVSAAAQPVADPAAVPPVAAPEETAAASAAEAPSKDPPKEPAPKKKRDPRPDPAVPANPY
ncbi:MAG: serine/threonine protein kinase [Labilithrix sp.]|nr:serine/threonine protein kinase [Labilithrix sp.]